MIIDFHTHVRRDQGRAEDFIAAMDRNGIDIAVVHAVVPTPHEVGDMSNEFVHEVVQRYPDRLVGFASVIPYQEDAPSQLEHYVRDLGLRGLKLHPCFQQFYPSDHGIFPTIRKAIELDIPVLFHTGPIFFRSARMRYSDSLHIDDLALAFPEAKIIVGHGNPFGYGPALAGKHPNVYMDTCKVFSRLTRLIPGLGEDTLEWMSFEGQIGSDKLLFGTDANPAKIDRFEEGLKAILDLEIEDEEKGKILGGNAARLLKLAL